MHKVGNLVKSWNREEKEKEFKSEKNKKEE